MEWIGSIEGEGGGIVVGSGVFFVVETDMNGATKLGKVAIQISEKEFDVAAEDPMVTIGEIAMRAMRLHVLGAEHADRSLELGTAEGKIEHGYKQKAGLPQDELGQENWQRGETERNHDAQRGCVTGGAQNFLANAADEPVVSAGNELISLAQGAELSGENACSI